MNKDPVSIANSANITTRDTRSGMKNPPPIYAVCSESVEGVGPDAEPELLTRRTASIELYTKSNNAAARIAAAALEAAMSAAELAWSKNDRIWIEEEQIFQTVYSYTYLKK